MSVSVCPMGMGALREQKKVSNPLELEFTGDWECLLWVLGFSRTPARTLKRCLTAAFIENKLPKSTGDSPF